MNDLFADISYKSINHVDEQLCGDHVEQVCRSDGSQVIVLADGLGSGVKASILSTLTSKIIATMIEPTTLITAVIILVSIFQSSRIKRCGNFCQNINPFLRRFF